MSIVWTSSCQGLVSLSPTSSADDPRLLGALRRAGGWGGVGVCGGLACVVEMKEWMRHICLCFTASRITLVDSSAAFLSFFFSLEQETV